MYKKLIILLISILSLITVSIYAITIDGNDSDWAASGSIPENSALVITGVDSINEWVFNDSSEDLQVTSTTFAQNAADITEFRLKSNGTNLFGLIRFNSLGVSSQGYIYPLIQIAIDYEEDNGASILTDTNVSTADQPTVSSDAYWERLINVFQFNQSNAVSTVSLSTVKYFKAFDPLAYFAGNYSHSLSTTGTTGFIEFSIPLSEAGAGDVNNYRNKTVNFTLASFYHKIAFDGNSSSKGLVYDIPVKDVNIADYVSFSSDTVSDVSDKNLQYYFSLRFDGNGNIASNSKPVISNLYIDGKADNEEVIVADRYPKLSWSFTDNDSSDTQRALRIVLNTSLDADEYISLTEDRYEELYPSDAPVLAADRTYTIQAYIYDSVGTVSDATALQTFKTISSEIPLDLTEVDMKVGWNNPFTSGQITKIRFTIPSGIDEKVFLGIYSPSGRLVKTLVDDEIMLNDVVHTVNWDGKDNFGSTVGSGVYFVNIRTGKVSLTEKVCFIR